MQFYYLPCFANLSFLAFLVKTIHSHICCFQPKHGRRPEDQVSSGCKDDVFNFKNFPPVDISSC